MSKHPLFGQVHWKKNSLRSVEDAEVEASSELFPTLISQTTGDESAFVSFPCSILLDVDCMLAVLACPNNG